MPSLINSKKIGFSENPAGKNGFRATLVQMFFPAGTLLTPILYTLQKGSALALLIYIE